MRLQRYLLAGVLFLHWMAVNPLATAADSPLFIPFQGQVTNQAGTVVADGQYSVIFNLYDQAVGGQPVWSERHVRIGVTRGMINVFLGSISPLANVDFSQTKYLGITVDNDNLATTADPEMVPRSLIIPSFYAHNAKKLAGHDWSAIMTGGSNNPLTGTLRGDKIDNGSITSLKLGPESVLSPNIKGGAITADKLGPASVVTAALANSSITIDKMAPLQLKGPTALRGEVAMSASTGDSATYLSGQTAMDVPALKVTLTTTGNRPVFVALQGEGSDGDSFIDFTRVGGAGDVTGKVAFRRGASPPFAVMLYKVNGNILNSSYYPVEQILFPASAFSALDFPPLGTHTYQVQLIGSTANTQRRAHRVRLVAFEL